MFVGFELELLHQQCSRHPAQSCWVGGTEIQGLFQVTLHYRIGQLELNLVCTLQRLQANLLCCGRWEVVIAIWIKLVDAKLGSCGQKNWSLRLEKGKLWGCKIHYYVVAQAMRILAHLKGGSIEWRTKALECAHLCPCGASFEAVKVQWVSTCVDNEHLCMEVCTQTTNNCFTSSTSFKKGIGIVQVLGMHVCRVELMLAPVLQSGADLRVGFHLSRLPWNSFRRWWLRLERKALGFKNCA